MTTELRPPYAGTWQVPDHTPMAWGARWIITQDGGVDFVWDRQGATPEGHEGWTTLQAWLDGGALRAAREELRKLLVDYKLSTREDREVILFADGTGVIRGNPRASAGYCYVVGYLTGEAGK